MLNEAQRNKYWRAWAAALKALRKLGHDKPDQELRYWVTFQALGREKSMTAFSNGDFDRFLAVCAGYSRMGDLDLQLALQDMPRTRAMLIAEPFLDEIGVEQHGREAYVRAIYRRVQAKRDAVLELEQIPDDDLALVISALLHTAQHKHGVEHQHPHSGKGRARYDHQVGARRERRAEVPGIVEIPHEPAPAPVARPAAARGVRPAKVANLKPGETYDFFG